MDNSVAKIATVKCKIYIRDKRQNIRPRSENADSQQIATDYTEEWIQEAPDDYTVIVQEGPDDYFY